MEQKNIIVEKSYKFALDIIKLFKFLKDVKNEYVISKQLLRCGTSIGANVNESQSAESTPDFIHKLSIAAKEARETEYWLQLLKESEYIDSKTFETINNECITILKILNSIILTSSKKNNSKIHN
ncbi:MAG: four helix bundle protein [FCB group bacterium]|jgi:four helix bundle protein